MPTSEFLSTHWSIVLRAGRAADSDARDALAFLCQRYGMGKRGIGET